MAPFRIEIRLRNVSLSEPLRQFVEQELQAWLAPWAELIEVVRVRLSDRGDTRGRATKECSLAIAGKAGWLAVVDQATPDLRSTIRAAAGAAAAEVPRQLENRSRFPLLRHEAAVNRSRIRGRHHGQLPASHGAQDRGGRDRSERPGHRCRAHRPPRPGLGGHTGWPGDSGNRVPLGAAAASPAEGACPSDGRPAATASELGDRQTMTFTRPSAGPP